MKKVAFITDGWKRLLTYEWNVGIKEAIAAYSEEVVVYQFNSYGNWSCDEKFNQGEYSIFRLPDFSEFDGILLDATNITDGKILEELTQKIIASNVPAVSLGRNIEGLYYVGINNMATIRHLMEHLFEEHHCRSFMYAGGPADNCDNMERRQAYLDFIQEKGTKIEYSQTWSGPYTFEAGIAIFDSIMEQNIALPDAIVCANDHIAIGVIVQAKKYGYEVPRDFIVTGFDNAEQSRFFKPHLTTVEQKRKRISYAGMQILFHLWNDESSEAQVLVENVCIFSQSCGCEKEDLVDYPSYVELLVAQKAQRLEEENLIADYQIQLSVAQNFEEVFKAVADYILLQNCQNFSLAIDSRLLMGEPLEVFPEASFDTQNLYVPVYIEDGDMKHVDTMNDFYERLKYGTNQGILVFSPIHFEERVLGLVMIKDGEFMFDRANYCNMLMYLSQALIRIYQSDSLSRENGKLEYLYKHDQLTGVYNRIALRRDGENYLASAHSKNMPCVIAFADADHFKEINDTYGHDRGDEILIEIAQTLDKALPNGAVYRYGGDEFIVLTLGSQEDFEQYLTQVRATFAKDDISVSIGYVISYPGDETPLEQYINVADNAMYENKRRNRK